MAGSSKDRQKAKFRGIEQDADGNVIYTGQLHRVAGDESQRRSIRLKLAAVLILLAAAVISSGCIDSKGAMGSFYVILPYIGEVSAMFALLWSSAKLLVPGEIRTFVLENSGGKIAGECRILTFFALAGLLFSAVFIARSGSGDETVKNILYLVLKLAAAVLSEFCRKSFDSLKWVDAKQ